VTAAATSGASTIIPRYSRSANSPATIHAGSNASVVVPLTAHACSPTVP
jgi:hypothetical protein